MARPEYSTLSYHPPSSDAYDRVEANGQLQSPFLHRKYDAIRLLIHSVNGIERIPLSEDSVGREGK